MACEQKIPDKTFRVYRKGDALRVRKWVIEYWRKGEMVDQRRMFGGLLFEFRLRMKMKRMGTMYLRAQSVLLDY